MSCSPPSFIYARIGPELEFPSWNPLDWRIGIGTGTEVKASVGAQAELSAKLGASVHIWERVEPIPGVSEAPIKSSAGLSASGAAGLGVEMSIAGRTGEGKIGVEVGVAGQVGVGVGVRAFLGVGTGKSWTWSLRDIGNAIAGVFDSWFGLGDSHTGTSYYPAGSYGSGGAAWGGPPSSGK